MTESSTRKQRPKQPPKQPRGRPRAFDPDQALDAALLVFWQRGYANTSLDALCEAAGVNRPSLYAALGDKQTIYINAFARYNARALASLGDILDSQPSLRAALTAAYTLALELYGAGEDPPRGCLAISIASVDAALDPKIAIALRAMLGSLDKTFTTRIKRAKKEGDASPKASATSLGRMAASVLHSLAVRVRAGEDHDALVRYGRDMAAMIADLAKN